MWPTISVSENGRLKQADSQHEQHYSSPVPYCLPWRNGPSHHNPEVTPSVMLFNYLNLHSLSVHSAMGRFRHQRQHSDLSNVHLHKTLSMREISASRGLLLRFLHKSIHSCSEGPRVNLSLKKTQKLLSSEKCTCAECVEAVYANQISQHVAI